MPIPQLSTARTIAVGDKRVCAVRPGGRVACVDWRGTAEQVAARRAGTIQNVENAVQVELGSGFGCVLQQDGHVSCFGYLDDLPWSTSSFFAATEVDLPGLARVIAVGADHACALLRGGTVYCWGNNEDGQLGGGGSSCASEPIDITDRLLAAAEKGGT
jgi:hypothetical protein